jgi:fatty-acyl-CoA synthase
MPIEWSLPAAFDAIAAGAPGRDVLVWKETRRSYGEVVTRTRQLAAFLRGRGLGCRRERSELERWECGQSTVALLLYNCPEYIEAMLGCFRARAVPFNVNQHYRPEEICGLLDMLDAEVVVYHRALAPLVEQIAKTRGVLAIDVDDASGVDPVAGSTGFEDALREGAGAARLPAMSPDDLYLVCTGGTTGSPKGVLWRQADIFVSGMGGTEDATAESLAAKASADVTWFAAPPLMHAAAQWTAFAGIHAGAKMVLHDDTAPFDARTILETIVRERVNFISIVGDAFARRLIDELRQRPYDLSSLSTIATGGAITTDSAKEGLLELLPHIMIVDGYGASETGGMAYGASVRAARAKGFSPGAGAAVLSADRRRFLAPGDDEIGWTARRGRVPLGYLGDPKKTEETFPILGGERVAVPGDRARMKSDGGIELLGRDSMVVNSGGEKIFVEEVESVLRRHPGVADAVAVGRPSDRFGEELVAVVQLRPGAALEPAELRAYVAQSIARFKAPHAIAFCAQVRRHASGKPDYQWARTAALEAMPAT